MNDRRLRENRNVPINLSGDQFRALGHDLVDRIADLFDTLPGRPVTTGERPSQIRALLDAERALPEDGVDARALMTRAADLLIEHSLYNGHPRFWGYITAPAAPIGVLGELLASAVNPNLGGWPLSPMSTEIELQTLRWIAELIGYPRDGGGILVSGGNMANFVGFLAARAAAGGADLRRQGMGAADHARLRVYASAETHTWIDKAADLFGLGTDAVRRIPTDDDLRIDTRALREQIAADRRSGERPFMVIGTAGSVSTGAVDPLPELAQICREQGLWFHVDGAYGGFAVAAPEAPADLRGLSLADSVAVDPHKWLYAPLEAGCALVRNPEHLRNAFSYKPKYYHLEEEALNFVEYGPQNSRGFRALKVWLQLQQAGRSGYARMIGEDIELARYAHALISQHPEFEPRTLGLSIATFRYVPADLRGRVGTDATEEYLNKLNEELLAQIEQCGEVFVSPAVIRERYHLRLCVVNFRTTRADIAAMPEIIARTGREVDRRLRGHS